jgi:ABC-type polar amino acid transport system ATPase subunit
MIVGPANSGKTNLIRIIDLVRDYFATILLRDHISVLHRDEGWYIGRHHGGNRRR